MTAKVLGGIPSGWRNVPSQPQRKTFAGPYGEIEVAYRFTRDGLRAEGYDDVRLIQSQPGLTLEIRGVRRTFQVTAAGDTIFVDSALGSVTLRALPRFADPESMVAPGSLLAPMPGTVIRVLAEPGATVAAGAPLVVLEAMKMEHRVAAPVSGVLTELNVREGQQVTSGAILAVITPS